ncbi:unnamed protein product [Phytomonas sp. Hart1]|nr:unnamed protein product [Phytomonas sp. Hart1]|eukprot:CCW72100.1 unnamed protein product [Phytomonas sp. isolate Hart1]
MRLNRFLRVRHDVVEQLLCFGRLADIQMANFFRKQLACECGPAGGETVKEKDDFSRQREAVRKIARGSAEGLTAWIGGAYGVSEWSTGHLSTQTLQAKRGEKVEVITLRGKALAAGEVGSAPKSVQVIAQLPSLDAAAASAHAGTEDYMRENLREAVLQVPLSNENEGRITTKLVNGLLQLDFHDAVATVKAGVCARDVASRQNILTATAYGGMLERLERICALHATTAVQYDGMLIRDPAVQMRLAQIACSHFGVESLAAYVSGSDEALHEADAPQPEETSEEGDTPAAREFRFFEAVSLNIYAGNALMDGLDNAWKILHGFPLTTPRPHRSKPEIQINYPYVDSLLNTSKYFITSMNGSMELQAQTFFGPLLQRSFLHQSASTWLESPLRHLMGLTTAAKVCLSAPHVNLRVMTDVLERDLTRGLELVSHQKDPTDPSFVITVVQYIAEVFANLAVVHRCSASLTADEGGRGHREWLLAQAFGAASAARRQRLLAYLRTSQLSAGVLRGVADLDHGAMHPVALMNSRPIP